MNDISSAEVKKKHPASQIITILLKDVFGTYFIEKDDWIFASPLESIGRTYFSDRKKKKPPINNKTIAKLQTIYKLALTGKSSYDPTYVAQNFATVVKNNTGICVDYLLFYGDDSEALRNVKIQKIIHLVYMISRFALNKTEYDDKELQWEVVNTIVKLKLDVKYYSANTYTEKVINNLPERYPFHIFNRPKYF